MKQTGAWIFLLMLSLVIMYVGATGRSGEMLACFLAPRIVTVFEGQPGNV